MREQFGIVNSSGEPFRLPRTSKASLTRASEVFAHPLPHGRGSVSEPTLSQKPRTRRGPPRHDPISQVCGVVPGGPRSSLGIHNSRHGGRNPLTHESEAAASCASHSAPYSGYGALSLPQHRMQIESEHPTAAKLRLFALHSLKPSAADHVEAHVEQCPFCTAALERVQAEHSSIRSDLRSNGLSAHVTEGGPVSVWVVENGSRWCIRLIGPMVDWETLPSTRAPRS